jgi:hypothetical protein
MMLFTFLRLLYRHGEYLTQHVGCDKTLIDGQNKGVCWSRSSGAWSSQQRNSQLTVTGSFSSILQIWRKASDYTQVSLTFLLDNIRWCTFGVEEMSCQSAQNIATLPPSKFGESSGQGTLKLHATHLYSTSEFHLGKK